jgi:hypothetical protein
MSLRFLGLLLLFGSLALAPCLKGQIDANTAAGAIDSLKTSGVKADSIAWKYKGVIGAGFNAVQLSNWSGGGQDAVTIRGLFLGMLDYAEQRFSWENDLDLGYSLTKLDLFRWTAFVDFRTQFYLGYNYDQVDSTSESGFLKISNLMAPGYLTGSLGSEWTPIDGFRLMVAPIASRTVFVLDQELADAGAFGVDPGTNVKSDFGAVLNATVLWEIVENVTWKARANAFMRYASPDLWVVTIENAILMKVNSFLSVGFLTDVFYDDKVPVVRNDGTVGPATQLRNQLVIDLTYTLTNF